MPNYLITQQEHYKDNVIDLDQFLLNVLLNGFKFIACKHDDPKETDKHIHVILVDTNKLKVELLRLFPKADILLLNSEPKYQYGYLLHNTKHSKLLKKIEYPADKIVTNIDLELFLSNGYGLKETNDIKILNEITDKIISHQILTFTQCVRLYRGYALKNAYAIQQILLLYDIEDK